MNKSETELKTWLSSYRDGSRYARLAGHTDGFRVELYTSYHSLSFGHGATINDAVSMSLVHLSLFESKVRQEEIIKLNKEISELEQQLAFKRRMLKNNVT